MKYLPKDTLAYYNAAPQMHQHDLSKMPLSVFAAATVKYRAELLKLPNDGEVFPNDEAITFYALNHCASLVRKMFTPNEPLPDWAVTVLATYTTVLAAQGTRMLHYILGITTREMRHLYASQMPDSFWVKLGEKHGSGMVDAIKNISADGNENTAVNKYLLTPPAVTVGHFIGGLAYAFHHGKWGSNYGGHPWGNVADACASMIHGTMPLEMLVDTGFALAHNGGPIFNKGVMYTAYDSHFIPILDVQRSGQIPDLMLDTYNSKIKKTDIAVTAVVLTQANLPEESKFKGYVDWVTVEAGRPKKEKEDHPHTYDAHIAHQKIAHPASVKPAAPPKKAKPVKTMIGGKQVTITGEYTVWPGQTVQTYIREGTV